MGARENIVRALLKGAPGGPHPSGIHVYHSSPHDFDKFDWNKLRTGEGANTYGAGFYFAENPAVSGQGGQYWNQFRGRFSEPEINAAEKLRGAGFNREVAIAEYQRRIDEMEAIRKSGVLHPSVKGDYTDPVIIDSINKSMLRNLQEEHDLLTRAGRPVGPRTYEVNIAARPELMLDWDKRLTEQPGAVQDFVRGTDLSHLKEGNRSRVLLEKFKAGAEQPEYPATGQVFYRGLSGHGDDTTRASDMLREAGIPGIRYLDQVSRGLPQQKVELEKAKSLLAGAEMHGDPAWVAKQQANVARLEEMMKAPPSYNYVVTDPSKLDILGKYGVVGTAGGGLGVLAAQDQYGEAR